MKSAFFLLLLLFVSSIAYGGWQQDFRNIYTQNGIDDAVVNALAMGANPDQIIKEALPISSLKQERLIKALFCALAQPETIRNSALKNGIKELKVNEGYKLALEECSQQMEENLNAALDSSQQFPGNSSSDQARSTNYASPWKFQ